MATPLQPLAPEPGFGSYIEPFTRLTTTLLVVMYGIGFVILAVYEAHYGIFQFSPLRARIFLVGFVFTALAALPAAAYHYGLSYYGPLMPVVENTDPPLERYRRVVLGSGFIYTAYLMAAIFSIFLFQSAPPTERTHSRLRIAAFLGSYAVLLFVYALIGTRSDFGARATLCYRYENYK